MSETGDEAAVERRALALQRMGIEQWQLRPPRGVQSAHPLPEDPPSVVSTSSSSPRMQQSEMGEGRGAAHTVAPPQTESLPSIPSWPELEQAVENCLECPPLVLRRTGAVVGSGNHEARWLFISDHPSTADDRQRSVFSGEEAPLFTAMLAALGLVREEIYLTHFVKCLPAADHRFETQELDACFHHLHRQITLIEPQVIVVMGALAAQTLLQSDKPISQLRGVLHPLPLTQERTLPLVVTYSPTHLLQQPLDKAEAWSDLLLAMTVLTPK
ncbi:MAG: uracil-DNA glycosylase [Gammaproteobacteria bacterium]|nr:uracil-DNA glycosylase [Gammaproteobacteria bacterium]